MSAKNQSRAMLLGLCAVLFWSTVAVAFKLTLQSISPIQVVCWAAFISFLVLFVTVIIRGQLGTLVQELKVHPGRYLLLGLINPTAYYITLFKAYDLLPAQQAQPINFTWALMLAVLAVPFLKQSLTWRDGVSMLVGYFGVVVIASRGDLSNFHFDSILGVILALASTVIWALYWIYNTRITAPPAVALALGFLFGTVCSAVVAMLLGVSLMIPLPAVAGVVYIGLFEMGLTFLIWVAALRFATHVSRVSNLIFLAPFLSLILIHIFLHESIFPATFIGLVLIITAVFYQQHAAKKAK